MQEGLALITGGSGGTAQAIVERIGNCIAPTRRELDITKHDEVRNFIEIHKPSILINCAGYIFPENVKDSNVIEWQKQIDVNLIGAYFCTKYALKNGATKIINIASAAGLKGRGNWSAYSASKAGLISLTESLIEEGVDAYCISPHRIDTKMRADLFPGEDKNTLINPCVIADIVKDIMNNKYERGAHIDVSSSGVSVIGRGVTFDPIKTP